MGCRTGNTQEGQVRRLRSGNRPAQRPGQTSNRGRWDVTEEVEPTSAELERARDRAALRASLGEGTSLDVATFTWPGEGQTTAQLRRNPDVTLCFALIESGWRRGELCERPAGSGTSHPGVGLCWQHGGETPAGRREGAWVVAHAFARALDVTPWEGLLLAVKIAAGKVAFCEHKLSEAVEDRQLEPPRENAISEAGRTQDAQGTNLNYWVKQSELWHDRLARVSKLAIDAGVAERLVRQLELEAQLMLRATSMTFDELGLGDDIRERALGIMSRTLLQLEAAEVGTSEE